MDKVIDLLQKLTAEVEKKEFILDYKIRPKAFFIGRDKELAEIEEALQAHSIVFVSGIAGIGKSELVKQYTCSHADDYDNVLYWTYEGNLDSMVSSDSSVAIINFIRLHEESDSQYAKRKIDAIHKLLSGHRNLMVIDNLDVLVEELPQQETWQLLKGLPCQILITTRCVEGLYKTLAVTPLADAGDLGLLFQQICPFDDGETDAVKLLIQSVGGDTLLVELLAHHTKATHAHPGQILEKLHSRGIGGLSGGAVRLLKDDRVTTDTVFSHIEKIFSLDAMSESQTLILAMLALLPVDGVATSKFAAFYSMESYDDLNWLIHHGWITVSAGHDEQIALHPTIASVVMEYIKEHEDLPKLLYLRCYDAIRVRSLAEVEQKSFADALALSTTDRFAVKCRPAAIFVEQYVNLHSQYGNAEKKLEQINFAIEILQSELPEKKYSAMLMQCNYLKARRLVDLGQYEDALTICLKQLKIAKSARDINFTAIWYFQLSCLYELIPNPNYVKQFLSTLWGTRFMVKFINDIDRRNPRFLDIQKLKEDFDYDYLACTKKKFYFNIVVHYASVLESQVSSDLFYSRNVNFGISNLKNAVRWRKQLAHKYKWKNKANEAEIEIDNAQIAFLSQNYQEAETLLTKLVAFQNEQNSTDTFTSYRVHQFLGQILLRLEPVDYEKVIAEFERCIEISENLVSHNTYMEQLELAYLYIVCGKRKEAIAMNIESFNEVKRLPVEIRKTFYADALHNIGYFYYANGIHARSRDYLKMALQEYDKAVAPYEMIQFGKARTKSHLAEYYLSNNCEPSETNTEEAVNYLESAVECYKSSVGLDHPEAKACLKRLNEIRQQT